LRKEKKAVDGKFSGYYREECDKIASFYDFGAKLFYFPFGGERKFRRMFVEFISPKSGERVLDVCCGTGTLSVLIAEKVGSRESIVGVDLSPEMIKVAKQKKKGFNIELVLATAELLPFKDGSFDKALCSLGLHEMTKTGRQNSLKETRRILKDNGKLHICDWNTPEDHFSCFIEKLFLKIYEGETAYNMVFRGNFLEEIRKSGFKIIKRKTCSINILQMILAKKDDT